jgi:hypothetical protein
VKLSIAIALNALTALTLALGLTACGGPENESPGEEAASSHEAAFRCSVCQLAPSVWVSGNSSGGAYVSGSNFPANAWVILYDSNVGYTQWTRANSSGSFSNAWLTGVCGANTVTSEDTTTYAYNTYSLYFSCIQ